jgi:hypothetical protein
VTESDAGRVDVQEKAGKAQSLFREVNERITDFLAPVSGDDAVTILCECADEACVEPVEIAQAEYDRVRSDPTQFIIKRGHEVPEAERLVAQNDAVSVVEKVGEAAKIAFERYRGGEALAN